MIRKAKAVWRGIEPYARPKPSPISVSFASASATDKADNSNTPNS